MMAVEEAAYYAQLTIERPEFSRLNHFRAAKKMVRLEFYYKQLWYRVGKDLAFNGNW